MCLKKKAFLQKKKFPNNTIIFPFPTFCYYLRTIWCIRRIQSAVIHFTARFEIHSPMFHLISFLLICKHWCKQACCTFMLQFLITTESLLLKRTSAFAFSWGLSCTRKQRETYGYATQTLEGTGVHSLLQESQISVYGKTHAPCSNTNGSGGTRGRYFPSLYSVFIRLISFPGSGNRIGQRHLAVPGWDEPWPPMRLWQAESAGELPTLSHLPASRLGKSLPGARGAGRALEVWAGFE